MGKGDSKGASGNWDFGDFSLLFGEVTRKKNFIDGGQLSIFSKKVFFEMEDKVILYCACFEIVLRIFYSEIG